MPAAAAVRGALPWHAGGARAGAGTAAVTGERLLAPATEGSHGAEAVGLGAPHPTRIPRVLPASRPLSPPSAPVGGGPASSLSSSLVAARPDIIPCAVMTVRGLLLPGSRRCRGLYRGAPPGNTPGAAARRDQRAAAWHTQAAGTGAAGQWWEPVSTAAASLPGVLAPPWQRHVAPVPSAWGNRGGEQRWGGCAAPGKAQRPRPSPPGRAGASPGGQRTSWSTVLDLSRRTGMWYPVPSAQGLPRPLCHGPQPQGRATSARGQGWERGHGDLAGSQGHCPGPRVTALPGPRQKGSASIGRWSRGGRTSTCPLLGTARGTSPGWRVPCYLPVLDHPGLDGRE